jgi:endonuclease I
LWSYPREAIIGKVAAGDQSMRGSHASAAPAEAKPRMDFSNSMDGTTTNLTSSDADSSSSCVQQLLRREVLLLILVGFLAALKPAYASEETVKLKFTQDSLKKVLKSYGELVGKPVMIEEGLKDKEITLKSDESISREKAIELVRSTLRQGHGIDLVETDTGVIAVALKVDDIPAPEGYYDAVAGLESEALKQQLQDITSRGHTPMGYAATRDVLAQIHEDPANTNNVITVYARKSVPKKDEDDWNREHVLPQSYGAKGGDYARSDLHNLFPSIIEINDLRGNLPFDESDDSSRIPRGAKLCSYDNDSWEPPDEVKGDLARAVFYMDVRYDGSDSPEDISVAEEAAPEDGRFAKLSTLLQWHTQDPVSEEERKRNNQVFSVQGNRNPFIDQPGFVESIYGNKSSSAKLSGTFQAKLTKEKEVITFKGDGMLSSSSGDSPTVITNTYFDNRWKGIDIPPRLKDSLYKVPPLE